MPYLLPEDPAALLALANHPRTKCEKTEIDNSIELILDEDIPYSIVVENIAAEGTRDMFKAFRNAHYVLFYIYSYVKKQPSRGVL